MYHISAYLDRLSSLYTVQIHFENMVTKEFEMEKRFYNFLFDTILGLLTTDMLHLSFSFRAREVRERESYKWHISKKRLLNGR